MTTEEIREIMIEAIKEMDDEEVKELFTLLFLAGISAED